VLTITVGNIYYSVNGTIAAAIIKFFVEVQPPSLGRNTCRCTGGLDTAAIVPVTDFKDAKAIGGS
jgi:hypothetical protein